MNLKYLPLYILSLLLASSCKKQQTAPVSIYGKWFSFNQQSKLYNSSGHLLDSVLKTKFTSADFVEYYKDGSGYFSSTSNLSPSLSLFTFTLSGNNLTQTGANSKEVLKETITALTADALAIHTEVKVADPNDASQLDEEIDDYTYHK